VPDKSPTRPPLTHCPSRPHQPRPRQRRRQKRAAQIAPTAHGPTGPKCAGLVSYRPAQRTKVRIPPIPIPTHISPFSLYRLGSSPRSHHSHHREAADDSAADGQRRVEQHGIDNCINESEESYRVYERMTARTGSTSGSRGEYVR
jgi:hypothetical protein